MFENLLLLLPFMTGLIFVIAGFIMLKFPPKSINSFYGYRTSNSMKNQESWDFAQSYSSKEMIKLGFILMTASLLGLVTKFDLFINISIGITLTVLTVILLIFRVEKAIKNKFGNK
ncbi:MAG: SdpI family protein [Bacteroidota bacterium]